MPELIEVENYRRQAEAVVGRTLALPIVLDDFGLRGDDPAAVRALLVGRRVLGTGRRGKLMWLDTDGPRIGLRFGMTGRLLVDGDAAIDQLEYSSGADRPEWDRFVLGFTDGGDLRIRDPRRLGGLELDPDLDALGPEASTVTAAQLRRAVAGSTVAVKARLLDQSRLAGLGNLLVDETLWRLGIDPARRCDRLGDDEVTALAAAIRRTVGLLTRRGGSHRGDLQVARSPGALCPRDGAPLQRLQVGGRTTFRCPAHQR